GAVGEPGGQLLGAGPAPFGQGREPRHPRRAVGTGTHRRHLDAPRRPAPHRRGPAGPGGRLHPQGASGWPDRLSWSPVAGCADPLTAILRARGFATGAGFERASTDAEFWTASAAAVIRVYLHAAALGGRPVTDVL